MTKPRLFTRALALLAGLLVATSAHARDWDTSLQDFDVTLRPTDDSVTVIEGKPEALQGMVLKFQEGGGSYPGVRLLPPEGETWNFSEFTCLDITLTNEGPKAIYATVRVDNPGHWRDKPWNNEAARLAEKI